MTGRVCESVISHRSDQMGNNRGGRGGEWKEAEGERGRVREDWERGRA